MCSRDLSTDFDYAAFARDDIAKKLDSQVGLRDNALFPTEMKLKAIAAALLYLGTVVSFKDNLMLAIAYAVDSSYSCPLSMKYLTGAATIGSVLLVGAAILVFIRPKYGYLTGVVAVLLLWPSNAGNALHLFFPGSQVYVTDSHLDRFVVVLVAATAYSILALWSYFPPNMKSCVFVTER